MLQSETGDVNTAMEAWFYGAFEGSAGVFVRRTRPVAVIASQAAAAMTRGADPKRSNRLSAA